MRAAYELDPGRPPNRTPASAQTADRTRSWSTRAPPEAYVFRTEAVVARATSLHTAPVPPPASASRWRCPDHGGGEAVGVDR
ncbi:hypothetical protein ACBJ59_27155 [Nonomuraea sp. MTCD27]|uniref:hypothetical protein n=1 Tax=Nonomuraea sp. MTCD27 TaxID=1676747 RepID=UPI0035BF8F95